MISGEDIGPIISRVPAILGCTLGILEQIKRSSVIMCEIGFQRILCSMIG